MCSKSNTTAALHFARDITAGRQLEKFICKTRVCSGKGSFHANGE
jgi:hypothetical protein